MQFLKPCAFTIYAKKSWSVWQSVFWLKALSILSLIWSLSDIEVQKLVVRLRTCHLWQLPDQGGGGGHWTSSVVVHCLCQFPAILLVSCHSFTYMTDHIFRAQRNIMTFFFNLTFFFCSHDDSSEPVPSTSSEQVNNRPPTQVNESARNLPVPAKGQELSMLQWKMLIAMESPKLEDTQSSAVVRWACTETLH